MLPPIVVVAFDRDEIGDLQPVFVPAEQHSEDRAIRTVKGLGEEAYKWSRDAAPIYTYQPEMPYFT